MGTGGKRDPLAPYETEILMISKMREILPKAFPILMEHNKWEKPHFHKSGVSGPQSNPARGGHYGARKGRQIIKAKATDIYLDASRPQESRLGDLLFDAFVKNRRELGILYVIWDAGISTSSGRKRAYRTGPGQCPARPRHKRRGCLHQNHLHVEFDRREGDKDHSAKLRKVVKGVQIALGNATSP